METDLTSDFTLTQKDPLESFDIVDGSLFYTMEHENDDDNSQDGDRDDNEGGSQITAPFESLVSWMYKLKSDPSAERPERTERCKVLSPQGGSKILPLNVEGH